MNRVVTPTATITVLPTARHDSHEDDGAQEAEHIVNTKLGDRAEIHCNFDVPMADCSWYLPTGTLLR